MTIDFPIDRSNYGEYCLTCHKQGTVARSDDGSFICSVCHSSNKRMLIIDPKLRWYIDDDKRYIHESAGCVIVNEKSKILLFELMKFPYGFTIPAGHVDTGEAPLQSVIREVQEEVGMSVKPKLLGQTMVNGDSCRRGSDDHKWSLFIANVDPSEIKKIHVDPKEGSRPVWISLDQAAQTRLASAIKFLLGKYNDAIKEELA